MNFRFIFPLVPLCLLMQKITAQRYYNINNLNEIAYYTGEVLYDTVYLYDTLRVHDTIYLSNMDSVLHHFNLSFDGFVHSFHSYIKSHHDSLDIFTEEKIYLNYFLPAMRLDTTRYRYIIREYTATAPHDSFKLVSKNMLPPYPIPDSLNLDLMLVLQGEQHIAHFLKSPRLQVSYIHQLFSDIHRNPYRQGRQIGINLYFPDFSFREKRDMAQFVKSVSLAIDSTKVKSIRGIPLYLTFDDNATQGHMDYLHGLLYLVDSIFLAERSTAPHPFMLSVKPLNHNIHAEDISILHQIQNQFYLARFNMNPFPETGEYLSKMDIEKLMNTDYPESNWEYYFFAIIGILLVLLSGVLLYIFIPAFTEFVHGNSMYVLAGGILLMLELYLLLVFMVERMSSAELFSFQKDNMMLYLPLMLLFVIPVIKQGIGSDEKP